MGYELSDSAPGVPVSSLPIPGSPVPGSPVPGGGPVPDDGTAVPVGTAIPGDAASADSDPGTPGSPLALFKILIAGGFGAGKTTLVSAISEVRPLRTEEPLTSASIGLDDLSGVDSKTTTTVAMDFGRITIGTNLVLYLFGTPGQERFWFMWDELAYGALGAVVLADTRRLSDCFPSVDYFEKRDLPFVVGINCFDGASRYDPEEVRIALDLDPRVPTVLCDARQTSSVRDVLITLVEHVLATKATGGDAATVPAGEPHLVQER